MKDLKLIFDADGVVCTGGSFGLHLEREYGIVPQKLAEFFIGTFPHCISGHKDLLAEISPLLPALGWHDRAEEFLEFWFTREHVVDERVLARVAELRQQGIACFLGTNQEKHRVAYMLVRMGFDRTFERVFASCELGAAKPEKEFYSKITAALGCRPAEIVLIDDSVRNVAGARAFGWQTVHYRSFSDLEGFLGNTTHTAQL